MPRQVMRAAALAALAALPEAAAFTAPTHSLALKTSAGAFCARSQPVSGMGRRAERRQSATALKMELLGKRYWMWNASEWMFDKFVALTQVVVFTLYGVITRLFESPYDEARLKAIRRRIAELRASREMSEPRNALDMMDVVWEVGAAGKSRCRRQALESMRLHSARRGAVRRGGGREERCAERTPLPQTPTDPVPQQPRGGTGTRGWYQAMRWCRRE